MKLFKTISAAAIAAALAASCCLHIFADTYYVREGFRFNVESVPQWMVWCFVGTEADENAALVQNPTPEVPSGDSPEYQW